MSQEEHIEPQEAYSCPECQAGILRLRHITYFAQLLGEFITVPEFPAWVCDVCGRREYDHRALSWLNVLLDPQTGRSSRPARRSRPTGDDPPASTLSE
ncbi:MAG: YgiT-type zinc finger protein [Anaerolineales bacterium]|nr:YgiT-type zinc finger protein [Anaerolineales bacterium]